MGNAQISDPDAIYRYVMAGRATLTLVSRASGLRFTFQVALKTTRPLEGETPEKFAARQKEAMQGVRFVKVLTGPDNTRDYQYIGHIKDGSFRLDKNSRFGATTSSVKAFAWFWDVLTRRLPKLDQLEIWHNGRCSRCNRELTVPESLSTGLGPVCAEELHGAFHLGTPTHTTTAARAAKLSFNPHGPLSFRSAEAVR
jgi:hypothetical protein